MTEKTARDAQRNANVQDVYIATERQPWLPFSPGIEFKVLRTTQETGHWTVLFKCAKGASFARHEHLAAGEYLMLAGQMDIRGGKEEGGVTAYPMDYGYEPNSAIHDETAFSEETVLYFTNFGPIRFMDDEDKTIFVLDWAGVRNMEAQAKAQLAAQPARSAAAE